MTCDPVEQVQQRVEEESRRIKEIILQTIQTPTSQSVQQSPRHPTEMILVPLGQKSSNSKFLPPIVEHAQEEEQSSGDVSFEQETVACDMWTPLSPVKWPRSRGRVEKVDREYAHQQLPPDLMTKNPLEARAQINEKEYTASIASKMTGQGDEETKMGGASKHGNNDSYREQLQDFAHTPSGEDKQPDDGITHGTSRGATTIVGSSQTIEMGTAPSGGGSMSLTAIEIEQLIAAEVEKRIAARDAVALAKTAQAVAISADAVAIAKTAQAVAISASRTLHEWKKNELHVGKFMNQKGVVRRNSIGGDSDLSRRGSPATATTTTTITTTETNVFIGNVEIDSMLPTPTKPRSSSMGGDVSAGSPPFSLRDDDALRNPTGDGRASSPSTAIKGLLLPLPRAKQTFTPERARAAMLAAAAAAQLGPLANATGDLICYILQQIPSFLISPSCPPPFHSSSSQWRYSTGGLEGNSVYEG